MLSDFSLVKLNLRFPTCVFVEQMAGIGAGARPGSAGARAACAVPGRCKAASEPLAGTMGSIREVQLE